MNIGKLFSAIALAALATSVAVAEPTGKRKWLVLDPITYAAGVDKVAFEGIDGLLRTTLVQADKYDVLNREAYGKNAAREQGLGANVKIVPAGYSISGEIVQMVATAKHRPFAGATLRQYVATVSLRVCDLETQREYEAETLRVAHYCETSKDMLVHVVNRVAFALLTRDFPLKVSRIKKGVLKLNYGGDFLSVGDQFEIRRREEEVDKDTGKKTFDEEVIGVCQITDAGKSTATAMLVAPCDVEVDDILRPYDGEPLPVAAPVVSAPNVGEQKGPLAVLPRAKPCIAVAPFVSKRNGNVIVNGVAIGARQWMDDCVSHINTCLAQSGSFRTLDRTFSPEVDRELARIENDRNADIRSFRLLSKKLAANYLVVAEVVFSDVASQGVAFSTGAALPPLNANFAEVRYHVINASTTEYVDGIGTPIQLNASYFGGTAEQISSASAAMAANAIVDAIQAKFDPKAYAQMVAQRQATAEQASEDARKAAEAAAKAPPPQKGVRLGF